MRIIALDELTDDMVLAKALFEDVDRILLDQGVTGLMRYKEKLREKGFRYLYVEDKVSRGIEINETISQQVRMEGSKIAGEVLRGVIEDRSLKSEELKKWVQETIDEIFSNGTVMVNIVDLRQKDEHLYLHSVNVAILALIVGRGMGCEEKQLKYLGIGAILHDIGMLLLPESLQRRFYKELDEEEKKIYRMHPQVGYELLQAIGGVDTFSKLIVWRHHEKPDGSGYPCGVADDKLSPLVRIVSACDVYDKMVRQEQQPPYQAMEYLVGSAIGKKDGEIVRHFMESIALFPVGGEVVLNDGRRGIVERQNAHFPARPVVRVVDGSSVVSVDLLQENNLVIERKV